MQNRPARSPDWQDCHKGPIAPRHATARQAFETGFDNLPGWVGLALRGRDRVVKPFGLATVSDRDLSMTSLPVLEETPNTYEVGIEDSHLTFTLQTNLDHGIVSVITRIWFNHWMGRFYLATVLLPHKYILRHAIRALA